MMQHWQEWGLLLMLATTGLAVALSRDLLASVLFLGFFSLLSALLFMLFDAPDVALTEAAVGAGFSTLLFLLVLALTGRKPIIIPWWRHILPLVTVCIIGGMLISVVSDLPVYGDPEAPASRHIAPYYLVQTRDEIGIPNIVTAVLGSYRGFDTLGETAVIFLAAIGITALLPQKRHANESSKTEASLLESEENKLK